MDHPQTVGGLTEILHRGGYLADRGLATALLVALSLQRPILLEALNKEFEGFLPAYMAGSS